MKRLKMFLARLFFSDLIDELKKAVDQNEILIDQIHDKKIYIPCHVYNIDSLEFLGFCENTVDDPRFIFMTVYLRDILVDEISKVPPERVVEARGALNGLYTYDKFMRERKARKLQLDMQKKREENNE